MKYYLSINSWNLLESFVTESISPFSFYDKRNFGNNLSRYLGSNSEKINFLILSDKDQGGDFTIIIDEALLDKSNLVKIKGLKGSFTYNKTIFYQKGYVSFRFDNVELKNAMIAETKILFEVKCIEKYQEDFFCKSEKKQSEKKTIMKLGESFSFDLSYFIENDNTYNSVKGAVVGFVRGAMTMSNPEVQKLATMVRDLKNSFAGLNTQIMVGNNSVNEPQGVLYNINLCKMLYNKVCSERTNMFDILVHQFNNIVSLADERRKELHGVRIDNDSKLALEREKELIENKIMSLQLGSEYYILKKELDEIKQEEVKRGESQGKKRCYFKAGTTEYLRKQELKGLLEDFEKNNSELRELKYELSQIKQQLMGERNSESHLDNTIASIFARISDIMIDLQKKVAGISTQEICTLNGISFSNSRRLSLKGEANAEMDYFNVLLNHLLNREPKEPISDAVILKVIEDSCNQYRSCSSYNTDSGQRIVNCLREYWKYKNQKTMRFDIPDNMPVLQAIMAFYIKPYGFEQIERFMLNKKYSLKAHAFMLWGASRGFADLPKTFTNIIYENKNTTALLDDKLNEVANIINNL